ncbi:MAG: hypothetical protein KAJ08_01615, partial [Deltaproteobacteria bacterium]|nr:hypothetical protein [Deltaproteobacteria bacterium]
MHTTNRISHNAKSTLKILSHTMLPIKKLFLTAHFLLIAGTSLTHAATTTTTITLQPDSAKECALCHYSWVDTFFYEKRSTEIATFPDKPTVAISQMCLS